MGSLLRSRSPERQERAMANKSLRNFIGGEFVDAASGQTADVISPVTGQPYATAPVSDKEDVDRAMKAAEGGFEKWRDATPADRQKALLKLADGIESRAEEFVKTESENTGKPLGLTMSEE